MPSRVTSRLVFTAWIASIPGFTASGVGNQLPTDETTWSQGGYVVVPATVGGTPEGNMPLRKPVGQVECWATIPGSDKLPWNMAEDLAEQIYFATLDRFSFGRLLNISENGVAYPSARASSAKVLTEPHQIWSDIGDYAGWGFDLLLQWTQIGELVP
jgi:hypothetical protein